MHIHQTLIIFVLTCLAMPLSVYSDSPQTLTKKLHHLRIDAPREWSDFSEKPDAASLVIKFNADENLKPWAIQLRQQDVKERWNVKLNGVQLGRLSNDANDHIRSFVVPAKTLKQGENIFKIEQLITKRSKPDDIRVGEVVLHKRSLENLLVGIEYQNKSDRCTNKKCNTLSNNDCSYLMVQCHLLEPSLTITLPSDRGRFTHRRDLRM